MSLPRIASLKANCLIQAYGLCRHNRHETAPPSLKDTKRFGLSLEGLESLEGLGGGRVEKTFVLKRRQLDTAWNLVKVTRRGCVSACELVEAKGRKPGFKLEVR